DHKMRPARSNALQPENRHRRSAGRLPGAIPPACLSRPSPACYRARMKALLRHPATQAALVWLGGLYLIFALRTTRWVLDGPEHLAQVTAGQATVAAFWHERLALMPMLWLTLRRKDPAQRGHVLVSRHRDGRFIGAVMRRFGVDIVYG